MQPGRTSSQMAVVPLFENVIGTINHARARTIRHIVHYMIRLYIYIKDLHQLANKNRPCLIVWDVLMHIQRWKWKSAHHKGVGGRVFNMWRGALKARIYCSLISLSFVCCYSKNGEGGGRERSTFSYWRPQSVRLHFSPLFSVVCIRLQIG